MCISEEYICSCWMEYYTYIYIYIYMYVRFVLLFQVLYFLIDLLSSCLFIIESGILTSLLLYNCPFPPSVLSIFTSCIQQWVCCFFLGGVCCFVYDYSVFLMDWPIYQCIMSIFVSYNNFDLKSVLFDFSIATPALFWLSFSWNLFNHPFTFNLFIFGSKVSFL